MNRIALSLAALFLTSTAFAHEIQVGDLQIIHASIPAPVASAKSAAGYMAIANDGTTPDRLIGVETGFAAQSMLHTTDFGADGVARMRHVPGLDIPADDTVVLEPGGYHIMLMGLGQTLAVGDMLPATLIFEHAGRVQIEFMVDPADGSVDHSTMDHSAMAVPAVDATATAAVQALLMAQFSTPDAPLTVAPITVLGDVAIAGWMQDGRAGRAFARRDTKGWFLELAAGASLMLPATLKSLSLAPADAAMLLAQSQAAETALGADAIALFDSFAGTMPIGRSGQ